MPIDPRIALGAQGPQPLRSPITTLGALSQLREHQESVRARQLQNEERRRALEDDYAIKESLSRLGNPDLAIEDLYTRGRATAASELTTQVYDWRKKKIEAQKAQQDVAATNFKMLTQIANGVTDQKSLDMARPAARALLVPVFGEEQADAMIGQLGTEYDPERIKQVRTWGTSTETVLAQQKDAREAAEKAVEIGRSLIKDGIDRDEAKRKQDEYWTKAGSLGLSTTKSQEQWDQFQRSMLLMGAPATLARFGNQWSPEAVENAKNLGMTAKERADVAHQKSEEAAAAGNLRERRRENDRLEREGGGPGVRPLTQNRTSEIQSAKDSAYRKLEEEFREYRADNNGEIPDDVQDEYAQRKLQIENAWRSEMGMKSMEDTEYDLSRDPSKAKDLRQLRLNYKRITGREAPIEQLETLSKQLDAEKDPQKRRDLQLQIARLRLERETDPDRAAKLQDVIDRLTR